MSDSIQDIHTYIQIQDTNLLVSSASTSFTVLMRVNTGVSLAGRIHAVTEEVYPKTLVKSFGIFYSDEKTERNI